jgi:hypothetical protein
MRIIAEESHGHWGAWFDSKDIPARAAGVGMFRGRDASEAIQRLLENSPAKHLPLEDFYVDLKEFRVDRVVVVLIEGLDLGVQNGGICATCRGTGQYVGLNAVETCQDCGGRGIQGR